MNTNFKNIVAVASVLFLQPMLSPASFALAKRKAPMKAYSFIAEGGKASQGECDGEKTIPRKLKQMKEFSKFGGYIGSEPQNPEIKGKANEEMWKHIFRAKPNCNSALAKTPSAIESAKLKGAKPELPPEEDEQENGNEGNSSEQNESAETTPDAG